MILEGCTASCVRVKGGQYQTHHPSEYESGQREVGNFASKLTVSLALALALESHLCFSVSDHTLAPRILFFPSFFSW